MSNIVYLQQKVAIIEMSYEDKILEGLREMKVDMDPDAYAAYLERVIIRNCTALYKLTRKAK